MAEVIRTHKIVDSYPWFDGGIHGQKFRFVVLEWTRPNMPDPWKIEYSRHMQLEDGSFIYGHYHTDFKSAQYDAQSSHLDETLHSKVIRSKSRKTTKKSTQPKKRSKK